ncbi:MAG TPA: AMP-binding protein, partial [Tepidisphaeraceae bacterium]
VTSIIPDAALRQVGRIDPLPVLEQVETWGVTRCVASPAFFERLLSADAGSLRQMKRIDTGGAPVFPSLLRRLQAAAPQAEVVALYGSTEAEPIAHVAWHEISADDVAAMLAGRGLLAGPVVEDVQLRIILDQWGTPIAPLTPSELDASTCGANEPGEIVVTGDHVLRGYLNGEGDSETKFRVDNTIWHRTGDAGYLDGRGRLWLLGRASAKIEDDRGTLYPFAIEAAASEIDGIRRSALVQHNGRRVLVIEPTGTASSDLPQRVMSSLGWAFLDVCRLLPHIPVDKRHNAKIDYTQLRRFL